MDARPIRRRVPGLGWEERSRDGRLLRLIADDGEILRAGDELVGTAEAAAIMGVRPPNFVRDWAARPDFPAPVGTPSSGRVWRVRDVAAYRDRHRPARPDRERLAAIARRVAWWDDPQRTLSDPDRFVARALALGSTDDVIDVLAAAGPAAVRRAVTNAPASDMDARARNYWQLVLGLPRTPAPPPRTVS